MLRSVVTGPKRVLALAGSVGVMVVLAVAVVAPPMAVGQATRTWVSGIGDDANPCSRTAPCKTFAGAISKTATNGMINCLDPGGFGSLTITKPITVDCTGTFGSVLAAGTSGFIINVPAATDHVSLRGLEIQGANTGTNGIRIISGAQVDIENVIIRGFRAANGLGMSIQPAGALDLSMRNVTIAQNGSAGGTGGGILIQPTGAGGTARVTLDNVDLTNNLGFGLRADTNGNTGAGISVTINDSRTIGNTTHGVLGSDNSSAATPINFMIDGLEASFNTNSGVGCQNSDCRIRIGRSVLTGNGTATNQLAGGIIESYQTNQIDGNTNDGTRTIIPQE